MKDNRIEKIMSICNEELYSNEYVYWNPKEEKYECPRRDLAIQILEIIGEKDD